MPSAIVRNRQDAIELARRRALDTVHRQRDPWLPLNETEAAHWMPPEHEITAIMQAAGLDVEDDGSDFAPLTP